MIRSVKDFNYYNYQRDKKHQTWNREVTREDKKVMIHVAHASRQALLELQRLMQTMEEQLRMGREKRNMTGKLRVCSRWISRQLNYGIRNTFLEFNEA